MPKNPFWILKANVNLVVMYFALCLSFLVCKMTALHLCLTGMLQDLFVYEMWNILSCLYGCVIWNTITRRTSNLWIFIWSPESSILDLKSYGSVLSCSIPTRFTFCECAVVNKKSLQWNATQSQTFLGLFLFLNLSDVAAWNIHNG